MRCGATVGLRGFNLPGLQGLSLPRLHAEYSGKKVDVSDLTGPKHTDSSLRVRGLYYKRYKVMTWRE